MPVSWLTGRPIIRPLNGLAGQSMTGWQFPERSGSLAGQFASWSSNWLACCWVASLFAVMVGGHFKFFLFSVGAQEWRKKLVGAKNVKYLGRHTNCKVLIKWGTSKYFFSWGHNNGNWQKK